MPRSHARIYLTIWADKDYVALPMAPQWLYEALCSQPDINQAGVLSLTTKRWSRLCADGSTKVIEAALGVLAERRYVVIDPETEELLVRTFIKNDEVWRSPNTLKSACTAARAVQSPTIRETLRAELGKLDMSVIETMKTPIGHEPAADAVRRTLKELDATPSDGYGDTIAEPIGDTKGDGTKRAHVGAGAGVSTSTYLPKNSSSVGAHNAARGARLPEDFAATPAMVEWARTHFPAVDGRAETAKFIDHWRAASGQSSRKRDWEAAWRNWIRKADEMGPPRNGRPPAPRPTLPADPEAAFADLRRRGAAAEAARLAGLSPPVIEPKPPSDPTDPREWTRQRAVEWLDLHKQEIRAALSRGVR